MGQQQTQKLKSCYLFHFQFQDFRFLCPNDTVFDQQNLVCTNWFEVDCHQSVSFFFQGVGVKTNKGQSRPAAPPQPQEPEEYDYNYEYTYFYEDDFNANDNNRFLANSTPSPNSGNQVGVGGAGNRAQSFQTSNNIDQDLPERPRPPPPLLQHTTTAIPISVTTTRRPPRVKSNLQNQNKKRPTVRPEVPVEFGQNELNDDRSKDPFRNPPLISADGKKPRVKSNLFKSNNNFGGSNLSNGNKKDFFKASQKVNFDKNQFKFVTPEDVVDYETEIGTFEQTLSNEPEVRPDGKPPRVKSNIEAIRNNQGRKIVTTEANNFDFVPTSRPLDPAPTVEPISEFSFTTRQPGSVPRVKSNLNTNFNRNRVVPQNELPGALSINRFPETTTEAFISSTQRPIFPSTQRPFFQSSQRPFEQTQRPTQRPFEQTRRPTQRPFEQTQRPFISSTLLPIFEPQEPEYVDEVDEFFPPEATTFRPVQRPTRPPPPPKNSKQRPRVKSNILQARRNKFKKKEKQERNRNRIPFNNVNFVSNAIENDIEEDPCSNPFKCPPSKPADGRKPRVKSNIKARNRNYFHPSTRKTNRIRGRPTINNPKHPNNQAKLRQGKAQRPNRRPFEKVAPDFNELPFDNFETTAQPPLLPIVTTESLLQTLLNEIQEERRNNFVPPAPEREFAPTPNRAPAPEREFAPTPNRAPAPTADSAPSREPVRDFGFLPGNNFNNFASSTPAPTTPSSAGGFAFTTRQPGAPPRVKSNIRLRPQPNRNDNFDSVSSTTESLLQSFLQRIEEEKSSVPENQEPLVFSRRPVVQRPLTPPPRPEPFTQTTPPPPPAIHFTTSSPSPAPSTTPFAIISSSASVTPSSRPFSSPPNLSSTAQRPFSTAQRPLSTRRPRVLSTTQEPEYEYYYEYYDYEEEPKNSNSQELE